MLNIWIYYLSLKLLRFIQIIIYLYVCGFGFFYLQSLPSDVRWTETLQQLVIAAFPCGYALTILIAGLSASRSGGSALLGYAHLVMSICSLLTPAAAKFMHTYAVIVLQFAGGLAAVSIRLGQYLSDG